MTARQFTGRMKNGSNRRQEALISTLLKFESPDAGCCNLRFLVSIDLKAS